MSHSRSHLSDGVEEAFYTTNRVITVSFHKFGDCFPGIGDVRDIGYGTKKYYSLNVPFDDGIDDESYQPLFKPAMGKVMEVFRPGAVILQCGADSLSGDRSCPEYWEERLKSERVERIRQTKEHWESQCRLFMG